MEKIEKQKCPVCLTNNLTLTQEEMDIPYFGRAYLFSMQCNNCNYKKSDVEGEEQKEPVRITFEINSENDMNVRVVKSSEATIKIPQLRMSVEGGPNGEGYVSNIEGVLDRFKKIIEGERDTSEDAAVKKTAKNLLKKLWKVKMGDIPVKIIIEDSTGNSAIISKKVVVEKLKVKK
ncbi:ZPR1 zinc finger domain-containing protein [Candidatus Woesearchaeota archaeon]|nr:ZPR1 zinc finger domain-containing protein [Candidatus Woesearchaeota archaeon]